MQSKTTRILAIIQLCFAFSLFFWYGSLPFSYELYKQKQQALIFQTVMGQGELTNRLANGEQKETLKRHHSRFHHLEKERQKNIYSHYSQLQERLNRSFAKKLLDSLTILTIELPPFVIAWMVFSVIISVMLLLGIPSAKQAALIIPLITAAYCLDNLTFGHTEKSTEETLLFPKESALVSTYLKRPLSSGNGAQLSELKQAWALYLEDVWAKKSPLFNIAASQQEKQEEGHFAFQLARAEAIMKEPSARSFSAKEPAAYLLLYLIWNLLFALFARDQVSNKRVFSV